jgi:hypothetical protein
MRFHGILWGSMKFNDVPVNRSVPTEANRGLTSYMLSSCEMYSSPSATSQSLL